MVKLENILHWNKQSVSHEVSGGLDSIALSLHLATIASMLLHHFSWHIFGVNRTQEN